MIVYGGADLKMQETSQSEERMALYAKRLDARLQVKRAAYISVSTNCAGLNHFERVEYLKKMGKLLRQPQCDPG